MTPQKSIVPLKRAIGSSTLERYAKGLCAPIVGAWTGVAPQQVQHLYSARVSNVLSIPTTVRSTRIEAMRMVSVMACSV